MLGRLVRHWWFWLAITLGAVVILLVSRLKKLASLRPKIVVQHKEPGEKLVVLFGDSITEGTGSYNYVDLLAQQMGGAGYRFMNAGVGGDTAYNLLQRMEPIIASQPDNIMILVGTNDVAAYLRGGHLIPFVQRTKKLPQAVTLQWYSDNLRQIVLRLQQETSARIALGSIPVLGEDLDSPPNQEVRRFNEAVQALADQLNVAYLPVYETMGQFLRTRQAEPGVAFDESRTGGMVMRALWDRYIRGRSWDAVSARHGLLLTIDTVHMNSRGGAIIAGLIGGWLHDLVA